MTASEGNWTEANQAHLVRAMANVRAALERHAAVARADSRGGDGSDAPRGEALPAEPAESAPTLMTEGPGKPPPALEEVVAIFGLSPFERSLLIMAAAHELDASFAPLFAATHGDESRSYPTFGLALAALDQAHWSAASPGGPLRLWRLIEVEAVPGRSIMSSPVRIDERILHHLAGLSYTDDRLSGFVQAIPVSKNPLPVAHREMAERVSSAWSSGLSNRMPALVQLVGANEAAEMHLASTVCAGLGLGLISVGGQALPAQPDQLGALVLLLERECALSHSALLVRCHDEDDGISVRGGLRHLLEQFSGFVFLTRRERMGPVVRSMLTLEIGRPAQAEQRDLWQESLAGAAVGEEDLDRLTAEFDLHAPEIRAAAWEAGQGERNGARRDRPARSVWDVARAQNRPRLQHLAKLVVPAATWDDLVLPDAQRQQLAEMVSQATHRATVYGRWGFARPDGRGLGITALFAGPSGTGKTLAAEVVAHALSLDLYCIDLSAVVSKYIGETEKNLRQVFDAAEAGGALLFFDEADALFGKRTEVKDSHDRYANIEVGYLLQRMEAYQGIGILATNRRGDLDAAFLRRLRFIVAFPLPEPAERVEIWRRALPPEVPTSDLSLDRLAQLSLTGGSIRNIALNAAFLAAGSRTPIGMSHVLQAARAEYVKLEKPLSASELPQALS